ISSDTIIVGLLSPNRKLFSDNNLQFYEKESTSVQITQILRKLKPAPAVYRLGVAGMEGCCTPLRDVRPCERTPRSRPSRRPQREKLPLHDRFGRAAPEVAAIPRSSVMNDNSLVGEELG
ncbi:MAG TPA: hypothetical protein VLH56_15900, partial [Dissulfurispiraceae bacterium]|nr:hypothetical protein [Dissulfurispiraceae bacterium]